MTNKPKEGRLEEILTSIMGYIDDEDIIKEQVNKASKKIKSLIQSEVIAELERLGEFWQTSSEEPITTWRHRIIEYLIARTDQLKAQSTTNGEEK